MSRYFLTRVSIEGFRGINNEADPLVLRFQPTRVTSVFAVNAAGKTSIFDALCFALLGHVPRLALLPADQRSDRYYCNCFHTTGNASVELDVQTDDTAKTCTVRVTRDRGGVRTVTSPNHPDPQALLRGLAEPFVLLDYQKFLNFVQDTPLARGRTMGPLLGLGAYAKFAKGLEAAAEARTQRTDLGVPSLETLKASAEAAIATSTKEIAAFYETVTGGKPDSDDINALAADMHAVLAADASIAQDVAGKSLSDSDFAALLSKVSSLEAGTDRKELADVVASLVTAEKLIAAADSATWTSEQNSLVTLVKDRDALLGKTQGDLVERLMSAAKEVVTSAEWTDPKLCPLCGSRLEFDIAEHVRENLKQYQDVAANVAAIAQSWSEAGWTSRLRELETASVLALPAKSKLADKIIRAGQEGTISEADARTAAAHLQTLEQLLGTQRDSLVKRRTTLEAKLPASYVAVTARLGACKSFLESATSLGLRKKEVRAATAKLLRRELWKKFTALASATFIAAEAELAKQRLARIEPEFRSMFADIAPSSEFSPNP